MFSLQILGFRNPNVVGGFQAANKQKTLCRVVILNTAAVTSTAAVVVTCTAAAAAAAQISPKNQNAPCGTK